MLHYALHETMPKPTKAALAKKSIVESMADKMLEMGMNGIAVTADSLAEHSSFTRAEIERHGLDAADMAKMRAVRRVA
ncbi:hypothetical protein [Mesorhizobium sp. M2A.F.Ca.ET.043.02.1.1]|uniref:hypothetical protein n=1 Tax=Mesorhizobium sp. M2A.F.Ca.ET.043.02.1.1 TaxID=2493670 RepID=UPI000F7549D2|nr:hypothetical protein [Mesorhizobium sp. M2A.F.Ca.ET.043.02.1.1]AZO04557.1 hypothetical protein EJ068_16925 [Mesorhizobium sp. M2A.F.Ca.ET.043.02.1.1]